MFEFDFLILIEIVFGILLVWGVITQIAIPLKRNKRLFPAFMQKGEKILQEVEDLREEELKREIERARNEERRVTLETELLETQQRAEEKRQQISRRQKQ
jgi:hypothetical protein